MDLAPGTEVNSHPQEHFRFGCSVLLVVTLTEKRPSNSTKSYRDGMRSFSHNSNDVRTDPGNQWNPKFILRKQSFVASPQHTSKLFRTGDDLYVAEIEIGEPPEVYSMLVDTGSPYSWVTAVDCQNCGHKKRFDPRRSQTATLYEVPVRIRYMSGDCEGTLFQDRVSLQN